MGRPTDKRIGREIRALRRNRGLTISELADISGLTAQQVRRSEVGLARISVFSLVQIAAALNVPVTHFVQTAIELQVAE
jgi:transcriptional regulator with XRE-family HTH domain